MSNDWSDELNIDKSRNCCMDVVDILFGDDIRIPEGDAMAIN